jgi:hypothetical protein
MERDRASERTLRLVGGHAVPGEAPWHAPAREAEVWEADVVPLPGRFRDDPDAAPALAIVGAAGFIVHGNVVSPRPTDPAGRARAVAEAVTGAGRELGVLPPALHVRDAALAEALAPELEPRGIAVSVAAMPELDDAIRESLKHMAGDALGMTVTHASWREVEAEPREVEAFHAATAYFHRAAPWARVRDDEPIIVSVNGHPYAAAVMGGGGMEFGLALYSDPRDMFDLYENADGAPTETLDAMRGHAVTVTFAPRSQLSRTIQRETAAGGWEVAGPKAYPQLYGLRIPGFRITAREVRLMTAVMAIIAAAVTGDEKESLPQCVQDVVDEMELMMVPLSGDDEEDEEWPWPELDEAHPIGPVGPKADPEAALRYVWSEDDDPLGETEFERVERFRLWMRTQGLSQAAFLRHLRTAEELCDYLATMHVPVESATEFDLRSFLYDHLPRRVRLPKDLKRKLDDSLRVFVRWLEAEEGIGWPWATAAIAERAEAMELRGDAPAGAFWDEDVKEWRAMLWHDLSERVMLHDKELPGTLEGWPTLLTPGLSRLRNEVQRRWLIWYDEAVRGGTTDPEELFETLSLRQRGWENTPHPQLGGRTPRQAVIEHEREVATGRKVMTEKGSVDATGRSYR